MSARYIIGDTRDVLASLPDASVDLVISSPPFLALRSYLPADHEHKSKEIGSEATPGAYLDVLLNVVEECARVLAPHGSLVFELGDSYSGAGSAGGDYADDGWRNGQKKFGGSASKSRPSQWDYTEAKWLAGVIDTEGSIQVRRMSHGEGRTSSYVPAIAVTMMDREVCDKAAEITGVGAVYFDENRRCYTWGVTAQQARYVLLHIWTHLLIKQRQACAAIELARHVEESERRGLHAPVNATQIEYREMIRTYVKGLNARGDQRGVYVPTWEPPAPQRIPLSLVGGTDSPMDKSLCMIPQSFAWALAYGMNPFTGRKTPRWRIRNVVAWCRPNPPVGALGDKFRPATSYLTVACKARDRWFDLDAVREPPKITQNSFTNGPKSVGREEGGASNYGAFDRRVDSNPAGAPPLDWWEIPTQPYKGAHYATWPEKLVTRPIEAMCPREVCTVCGTPRRRIVEDVVARSVDDTKVGKDRVAGRESGGAFVKADTFQLAERETLGWTDCNHGGRWRRGVVLDPFAGSGTTLAVAEGLARDSIGIDLDARNAELAYGRCGMFLTVETYEREGVA